MIAAVPGRNGPRRVFAKGQAGCYNKGAVCGAVAYFHGGAQAVFFIDQE
jgi:hypothetical protein